MKKTNKLNSGTPVQIRTTELLSTEAQPAPAGRSGTDRKDNRLPIDAEARQTNRSLPTDKVLNLLQTKAPELYNLAEVVGKWVWVHFQEQPAAEIRQTLAQLGFHWNNTRQTWQHPCGTMAAERADYDPRRKYGSYYAADQKAA